jgi:hypothetical protein
MLEDVLERWSESAPRNLHYDDFKELFTIWAVPVLACFYGLTVPKFDQRCNHISPLNS